MGGWGENAPFCEDCGHSWWHHAGLYEPGCSYLGSCRCVIFHHSSGATPAQIMFDITHRQGLHF